jgi:carbamoyl-phosphate synthase large subunit
MAIGRTFKEAFMKAFRSLELGRGNMLFAKSGGRINATAAVDTDNDESALQRSLAVPNDQRMWSIFRAFEQGWELEEIHRLTKIDRWFLTQFKQLVELKNEAALVGLRGISPELMRSLKRAGFGDWQIGNMLGSDEEVAARRASSRASRSPISIGHVRAEFEAFTPYLRTYEPGVRGDPPRGARSSSSAAARTASGRGSSSTTAACTPRSPCATTGSRR